MKRFVRGVILCSLVAVPAYAGSTVDYPVIIGGNFAVGGLKTARLSSDSNQYIGCYTYQVRQADGSGFGVTCFAKDSAGTSRSCVNNADTLLLAQARTITYRSWISFSWDDIGICKEIYVQNSSDIE
jgi:hypothetical protein